MKLILAVFLFVVGAAVVAVVLIKARMKSEPRDGDAADPKRTEHPDIALGKAAFKLACGALLMGAGIALALWHSIQYSLN